MYQIFESRYGANPNIVTPPGIHYLKRTYRQEIKKIIEYYNTRVFSVKSEHFLAKAINTASSSSQYDLDRYMQVIYARSPMVSKQFRFTSEVSYGTLHEGVFYGPNVKEVIFYNEEYFSPFDYVNDWKSLKPIKVLSHPISDLGLMLPNGKKNSTAEGMAFISINFPMLMFQYRQFELEQYRRVLKGDIGQLGIQHFIHMYVLPNMMESHLDIVIVNRLMNLHESAPMSESLSSHPFRVIDYKGKLDIELKNVLKYNKGKKLLYEGLLKAIPSVFSQDGQESLLMPDLIHTRQAWWALLLARLPIMEFLIDYGGDDLKQMNKSHLASLKVELKRLLNSRVLNNTLDRDTRYDYEELISLLLNT